MFWRADYVRQTPYGVETTLLRSILRDLLFSHLFDLDGVGFLGLPRASQPDRLGAGATVLSI